MRTATRVYDTAGRQPRRVRLHVRHPRRQDAQRRDLPQRPLVPDHAERQFLNDKERDQLRGVVLHGTLSFSSCKYGDRAPRLPRPVPRRGRAAAASARWPRCCTTSATAALQTHAGRVQPEAGAGRAASRARPGKVVLVSGPVLVTQHRSCWWRRFESRALGTPEMPRKGVIEPELEVAEDQRHYYAAVRPEPGGRRAGCRSCACSASTRRATSTPTWTT